MRILGNSLWMTALAALTLAAPALTPRPASAEERRPVAVVSVASTKQLIGDLTFLADVGGNPLGGAMLKGLAMEFTKSVDPNQPAGMLGMLDGDEMIQVSFLAIDDLPKALRDLNESLDGALGKIEEAGDGVWVFGVDRPMYAKQHGKWAYLAEKKGHLADLPDDPAALLGDLPQQYTLAARLDIDAIPAEARERAMADLRDGFEAMLEQIPEAKASEREEAQESFETLEKMLHAMMEQGDGLTMGWAVNREDRTMHMDFAMTAKEDTKLAEMLERLKPAKSDFAGFDADGAAMSGTWRMRIPERMVERLVGRIDELEAQALDKIASDPKLKNDDQRAAAREIVTGMLGVAKRTVSEGRVEGGCVLRLEPDAFRFAAGGRVADGAALEQAVKQLAELAGDDPHFPEVKFDVETVHGVRLHTLSAPIKESDKDARKILGDRLHMALGFGEQSAYVAFGEDPLGLLKEVLHASAEGADKPLPPGQLRLALGPIMVFADEVDDRCPYLPFLAAESAAIAGNDHVTITTSAIENGAHVRIDVESGVLKLLGKASKLVGPGGGLGRDAF